MVVTPNKGGISFMSKILGFVACAAMVAMLAGCKDQSKPESKAEGLLKKTEAAANKAADKVEKAAVEADKKIDEAVKELAE